MGNSKEMIDFSKIEDLKKVKLNFGDVLAVTMNLDVMQDEEIAVYLEVLREIFPKNEILIISKKVELSVISKENIK